MLSFEVVVGPVTTYFALCATLADQRSMEPKLPLSEEQRAQLELSATAADAQVLALARSASTPEARKTLEALGAIGRSLRTAPATSKLYLHLSGDYLQLAGPFLGDLARLSLDP